MPPAPGPAPAGRRERVSEWQRAHRAAWPILFCGGVLGTAHGIALAAMPFMDAPASIPFVFVLSGVIVEVGMWLVARGAGKAALR